MFSSYGRGCSSELIQAVDRFVTPPLSGTPVLQAVPRGFVAARDVLVVALADHNNHNILLAYWICRRHLSCGILLITHLKFWIAFYWRFKDWWLFYLPPDLTFTDSTFSPQIAFTFFAGIIFLCSLNWQFFITETGVLTARYWLKVKFRL